MKKFTNLDEDLLKENQSAQKLFNMRLEEFERNMDNVNSAVNNLKDKYQSNLKNWGYAGSLGYINEQLNNILQHIEYHNNSNK
jgi:hypothetical protein